MNGSNHSFSSNFLDPSHFENGFSLTSLISSLFHLMMIFLNMNMLKVIHLHLILMMTKMQRI